MRQAQTLTGFILMGMFLLLVFAVSWFLIDELSAQGSDRLSPQGAAAGCMNLATQASLQNLGRQTIIPLHEPIDAQYKVSLSSKEKSFLLQIDQVENGLNTVFSRHFVDCLNKSSYDMGFKVINSDINPQASIKFSPTEVIVKMAYPVELQRGSELFVLQPLTRAQPSQYKQIHGSMGNIIEFFIQEKYLKVDELVDIPNVFFKQTALKDGFSIFITDGSYKAAPPINYTFILQ